MSSQTVAEYKDSLNNTIIAIDQCTGLLTREAQDKVVRELRKCTDIEQYACPKCLKVSYDWGTGGIVISDKGCIHTEKEVRRE